MRRTWSEGVELFRRNVVVAFVSGLIPILILSNQNNLETTAIEGTFHTAAGYPPSNKSFPRVRIGRAINH
ncbi:hypothetical protein PCCS19_31540 [Paenibacillus sp. CCS19]|uniref:hypothetical protein n=1 Tax=Paenibacillus sp. CCS19 TaxID=3158387 RepID=UPI00256C2EDA|nr:hypothetical protein [Paenibacillus cellulosilyticus]GMK40099.1 hypothetical protein PCCS19_31540 [Paenibacillus cellulosilyticus]